MPEQADRISVKCGYCEKGLKIPKEIYASVRGAVESHITNRTVLDSIPSLLEKQYNGFYVSRYGYYYCSRNCLNLFTED